GVGGARTPVTPGLGVKNRAPLPELGDPAVTLIPSLLPQPPTDHEHTGSGPPGPGHHRPAHVFSGGGRPAHPPRLPPHGGQRLPGASHGHRGVQDLQDHRGGRPLGGEDLPDQPVLQGHFLIRTTRRPLGWISRWSGLRCWGCPSACSCGTRLARSVSSASPPTYYRGAQAIVIVFDINDVESLEHTRQWLDDALKENDPSNVILFLVGSKKDLSTPAKYSLMEKDALKVAQEMQAEYWAVSSLTGENVRDFFFRVAALTFENSVLAELERGSSARRIGDTVRISSKESDLYLSTPRRKPKCCQ
uniref:RAB34, member RAS onco family n=1 Tax=Taeniopygia guttata TaxID=59729 RepID=H0Z6X9_TAEGU